MPELSFNEALFQRTAQLFTGAVPAERVNDIYKFTKEVALESFRNGLAAGRRKSASRVRDARTTRSE
jgi:hypothetical protein